MPTDRWHRLDELFTEAVAQPAGMRADFLARTCGPDAGLRDEIASLLAAAEQSGDFLSAPALDVFARQISREGWSVQPGDRIAAYTVERATGSGRDGRGVAGARRAARARRGDQAASTASVERRRTRAQRFSDEARAAGTLNHINVLTVYDVGDHGGAPYLVTECLEGESLRARLERRRTFRRRGTRHRPSGGPRAWCRARTRHRASRPEAGEHLPGAGRPGEDPRFRPRDTARLGAPASPSPELTAQTTRSLVAGTAGYMAPEQIRGEAGRSTVRTSSRSARCSTKCSPAAGRSRGTARSRPWTRS